MKYIVDGVRNQNESKDYKLTLGRNFEENADVSTCFYGP